MSDFPRGWTLSTHSAGGVATITVPAITGVVHVLDGFTAKIFNGAGATADALVQLSSSDGVFTNFPLAELAAPTGEVDSSSESGLDLAAGPGASLTIAYNASLALLNENLLIQGHDI